LSVEVMQTEIGDPVVGIDASGLDARREGKDVPWSEGDGSGEEWRCPSARSSDRSYTGEVL
jgi:hypothetical protein